jgi:hypothetical protein
VTDFDQPRPNAHSSPVATRCQPNTCPNIQGLARLKSPLSGPPGDGHNARYGRSLAVAVTQSLTASHRSWFTEVILGDHTHG